VIVAHLVGGPKDGEVRVVPEHLPILRYKVMPPLDPIRDTQPGVLIHMLEVAYVRELRPRDTGHYYYSYVP
jgi:hypothetical protein